MREVREKESKLFFTQDVALRWVLNRQAYLVPIVIDIACIFGHPDILFEIGTLLLIY